MRRTLTKSGGSRIDLAQCIPKTPTFITVLLHISKIRIGEFCELVKQPKKETKQEEEGANDHEGLQKEGLCPRCSCLPRQL